jgi:tRNA 2-thiocytidine biosynthesis protein TtcA
VATPGSDAQESTAASAGSRLEKRLARSMASAIEDFKMISDGDRILVAVSGGKDSLTLHHLLASLKSRAPVRFTLVAVTIDQGHPDFVGHVLTEHMRKGAHEFQIVREDTYGIVTEKIPAGKTRCSLCSRLRRGILYRLATELGCSKIALGHHRDDVIETLLLNLFFSGQLKAMPPKLVSDDGAHVVVRPLVYCAEQEIAAFASQKQFPVVACGLCGSQTDLQRRAMSTLLSNLERQHPGIRSSALAALKNARPSHLLDVGLWRKLGLEVARDETDPLSDVTLSERKG